MPDETRSHLLSWHPKAAVYFSAAQHMSYYSQGVVDVRTLEYSSGSIPHTLHIHCVDVNLVTQAFTERKGWCPHRDTVLSTGTNMEHKVLPVSGTVDTADTTSTSYHACHMRCDFTWKRLW